MEVPSGPVLVGSRGDGWQRAGLVRKNMSPYYSALGDERVRKTMPVGVRGR